MTFLLLVGTILGQIPHAAKGGPYAVGVTTLLLEDASRHNRQVRTEVWYPAESEQKMGPVRDAPVSKGQYPLILFSHGSNATRVQSTYLTEHWASHGFVVVAPDHQGNTVFDGKKSNRYQSALDRPLDASFVLDQMTALNADPKGHWTGRVDVDRIGAAGHSFGGYTVLVLAGALLDSQAASDLVGRAVVPDIHPSADPRIKAIIAYAPPGPPIFTEDSLKRIRTPTLVFGGMMDQILPYETHQRPLFDKLGGHKYLVAFRGGSHFTFNNAEFLGLLAMVKPNYKVKENLDRSRVDAVVRAVSLGFWRRHLLDDDGLKDAFVTHTELADFFERQPNAK